MMTWHLQSQFLVLPGWVKHSLLSLSIPSLQAQKGHGYSVFLCLERKRRQNPRVREQAMREEKMREIIPVG